MNFQIGQTLALEHDWGARQIFEEGKPRWHALTVPVMKEAAAEAWLKRRGVYSFHPVKGKTVFIKGKAIERKRRYLPGYVFARFPGQPIIHKVLASQFISGAISFKSGVWGILSPDDLRGIHTMRDVDHEAETAKRSASLLSKGDRVRVLGGLTGDDDQEVEIVELTTDGRVKFKLRLFGTDVPAETSVDKVVKVA